MLCLSLNVTPLEPGARCHFGLPTANRPTSAVCCLGVLVEGRAAVQTASSDKKGHTSLVVTVLSIWSRQRGTQQYLRKKLKLMNVTLKLISCSQMVVLATLMFLLPPLLLGF